MGTEELQRFASECEGELFTDSVTRLIYATDASMYREVPSAVFYPRSSDDIKRLVAFASRQGIGIIPRAAGTSLAGQAVGSGIVADISRHMTRIISVNREEQWVDVEPGVVLDELNSCLKSFGLMFGPETSTANRCNIGGMIGNNACGLHSLVYGSVRDHIISVTTVLYDGSEVTFGPVTPQVLDAKCSLQGAEGDIYRLITQMMGDSRNREAIISGYPLPSVPRRNTAYALDDLASSLPFDETGDRPLNLARLVCGSEGTLGIVTGARLGLVPLPPPVKALSCVHLKNRNDAFRANLIALKHNPWAVEMMDHNILSLASGVESQKRNRFFIEGDPAALLIVEFCADTIEGVAASAAAMESDMRSEGIGYSWPLITGRDIKRVWDLRKAGLGILSNMPGDAKPVSLIEDCAVDVQRLGDFVSDIEEMLNSYGKQSVYHAHIGSGELHIRPVINIKDPDDAALLRKIAGETAVIVKKYRGSLSGEHGDGRLRGEFIPVIIGDHNYSLNRQIKKCFDPSGIFNPGKICDTPPMDGSLRYVPGKATPQLQTFYDFSVEGGIVRAAEKCNGSGDCRKSSLAGGTMCPSFMATGDERLTTRARANIVREMLSRDISDPWESSEMHEILDLCLACKGCRSECPSGVDMAKLKSEFLQHHNDRHAPSLRTRLIAFLPSINRLFSPVPRLFNFFASHSLLSSMIKKATGFASKRSVPLLAPVTLRKWMALHPHLLRPSETRGELYLFVDEFTDTNDTEAGIAAVRLLSGLGYAVRTVPHSPSARTFISKGFLRKAGKLIDRNVDIFHPLVSETVPLVGTEPSAILGFRDEYPELCSPDKREKARQLAANAMLLEEFLTREHAAGRITSDMFTSDRAEVLVHAHCQEKSIATSAPLVGAMSIPSGYIVTEIASGCCGMAGAFGYEKEHYDLSMKIGELVLFPAVRAAAPEVIITAPGTSCRHHIIDATGRKPLHPAEVLLKALKKQN